MIILKSNKRYDEILRLDPATGFAELGSRKAETVPPSFKGHFAESPAGYVCLYRWNGKLVFRQGKASFEIPSDAIAKLEEAGATKVLQVVSGNTEICRWAYPKPETDFIDSLRYTDEEDSDFGVFVRNVINDKDQQNRMCR